LEIPQLRHIEAAFGSQSTGCERLNLGEARARRRAHAQLLSSSPLCIYCGGNADTVEHMPPAMMFIRKQRPKGLEFPSCRECNNGTSKSDLVASLIGRLSVKPSAEVEAAEFKKLLRSVQNNVPGLLEEMKIGRAGQKFARKTLPLEEGGGVMRTNGPLVTQHMLVFGAKLGFALHYEALKTIVPPTGGVAPLWFSNAQAARGQIPKKLFSLLPATRQTLRQGRRDVSKQFQYTWAITQERNHALFYATFHRSFAIAVVSAMDRTAFIEKHAGRHVVVRPGAFR
jgi:hypothetical protein